MLHPGSLSIAKAEVFEPFRQPAQFKGAHGGRGSGKSHEFAANLVLFHAANPGARSVCIRENQRSLKESAKALIEAKVREFGFQPLGFEPRHDCTVTPGGGTIVYQGMKDHTADSVKSLEGMQRAWVEEAQTLSKKSLELLLPTIREPGSELWFSWNPRFPTDPVDQMLRGTNRPKGAIVVEANWYDNPWFPKELEQMRRHAQEHDPDRYRHIWEGDYAKVFEGAYFADHLSAATREGRVDYVAMDSLHPVRAYWDIGGTSKTADATAIWIVQFIGERINVLAHYEAVGQEFAAHVHWLRDNGYERAICHLPHDGGKHDMVQRVTPASYLRTAGFRVVEGSNLGGGAAMKRVEAVRRVFHRIRFNAGTTEGGRTALSMYHAKRRARDDYDLGPEHDMWSHSADAFGEMATDFLRMQETTVARAAPQPEIAGIA